MTSPFPVWVVTPHDLAAHLMDGTAVELGRQLDDLLDEHRDAVEGMTRLREVLVSFCALAEDDRVTDPLDLLDVLLPPVGGG